MIRRLTTPRHTAGRHTPRLCLQGLLLAAVLTAGACAPRQSRFFVADHRADGSAERYFEDFPETWFCHDAHRHVDIVARREVHPDRAEPGPTIQVLHIRRIWAAVPGQTYAEQSMINATVSYMITGPNGGATYDGGGFVTFRQSRDGEEIVGRLESSALDLRRRIGEGADVFERVAVTGEFVAARNKREVVRVLNEMKRLFGPLPRYQPPPVSPHLR